MSLFLSILFLAVFSQGADQSAYKVESFYQAKGYLTERFIPFAIHRPNGSPVDKILSVDVAAPCHSMVDPHRDYIFHIYCEEAGNIEFTALVQDGSSVFRIPLPAIAIKKLALVSSTPKPDDNSGTDPLAKGRKIFTNNCAGCHPAPHALPATVTSAGLTSAFNSVGSMAAFKNNFFTASELNELTKFINEGL